MELLASYIRMLLFLTVTARKMTIPTLIRYHLVIVLIGASRTTCGPLLCSTVTWAGLVREGIWTCLWPKEMCIGVWKETLLESAEGWIVPLHL